MSVVIGIIVLLLFLVTVGKLSGRLLGVRLGRWRGLVVGALGWCAGVLAALFTVGEQHGKTRRFELTGFGDWLLAVVVILFFGVLAAMPIAIALDLLTRRTTPVRSARRWRLPHPVRAAHATLAPYGRLREIVGNARRAGLLHFRYASVAAMASPDTARRVHDVLEESGGMLIKVGQIASTRADALPPALIAELSALQADVRPVPAPQVREMLETELGEPTETAFRSFEWEPLAAASIGQTHRAVLVDGTRVVVKVQRPGVADIVRRDGSALRLVAAQLERRIAGARMIGIRTFTDELIAGLEQELHYEHEAAVGLRLRQNRAKDLGIAVPEVFTTMSTDRVLVMEEVIGRSVADQTRIDAVPVPRAELARRLLISFFGQVLSDGLFHADPHPGNVLLDEQGTIWLLDFGSVGRLDPIAVQGLRGIAIGVATKDSFVLARATRDLAQTAEVTDLRALEADLGAQLADLDGGAGVDARVIGQVLAVMERHNLRPPSSVTLLARAMITLEGTLKLIDPTFSIAQTGKSLAEDQGTAMFGTPQEALRREALRTLPSLRTLPEHAEMLANQLRSGRLTVRSERFAGSDRVIVDRWIDRVVLTAAGGFGAVAAALLLFAAAATTDDDVQVALWILGFAGLTGSAVLLLRSAARALRRNIDPVD